ncbi:hypothetical protein COCSUDRAFT_60682 [Coccomyxa subellipsoidea C-169]|uniref:Uncharacterized protein n=1 Tax=Coccomyxa subellipsoidea (strain C-169) TaxID=574566 RepID=I0Z4U9_COCSC|nr:hypothetical protein COCSUDRAFT_60682 [Coccomyxa subellipsoidea C-169]EIE25668.1 hypothetical protein COCSUDRAFT_60682 [Coccomyxa subellipsoidea C-169]|eukprot:XP_005650212.1 hypothetical protein COCSUDRAFT_60682 [Coccomyxa subellipsoidea C-169]
MSRLAVKVESTTPPPAPAPATTPAPMPSMEPHHPVDVPSAPPASPTIHGAFSTPPAVRVPTGVALPPPAIAPDSATDAIIKHSKMTSELNGMLSEYEKGMHFPSWRSSVEFCVDMFKGRIPQAQLVHYVRKKLGPKARTYTQTNPFVTEAETLPELLHVLEQEFRPRKMERAEATANLRQSEGQKAKESVDKVKASFTQYNCAFPQTEHDLHTLILRHFNARARRFMSDRLRLMAVQQHTLSMSDLEEVAREFDADQEAMKASPSQPVAGAHRHDHYTRSRARQERSPAAMEWQDNLRRNDPESYDILNTSLDDANHRQRGERPPSQYADHSFMPQHSMHPDRSRGAGRGGGGRQMGGGRGQRPSFQEGRPTGQGPPGSYPQATAVSLSGNVRSNSPQLPRSANDVHVANLRGRPRKAEPELRTSPPADKSRVPAQNSNPLILDRYRARTGLSHLKTGRDAVASSPVNLSMKSLAQMVTDKRCQKAQKALQEVASWLEESDPDSPAQVSASAPTYSEVVQNSSQSPIFASPQAPSVVVPQGAQVNSAQMGQAVMAVYNVSMPHVQANIVADKSDDPVLLHLDSGASMGCISQKAWERDQAKLKASGATRVKLQPLKLCMYNNVSSIVTEYVVGANVQVGRATYTIDLLVVPDATYDYLLGPDFLARYAVSLHFHEHHVRLGCSREDASGRKKGAGYQRVPLFYTGSNLYLRVQGPRNYHNNDG